MARTAKAPNGANGHAAAAEEMAVNLISEAVKKPSKQQATNIVVPELRLGLLTLNLVGETSLIVHRFPTKVMQEMLAIHMGEGRKRKDPKDPEADFLACLYAIGAPPKLVRKSGLGEFGVGATGRFGFPAGGPYKAAIGACRQVEGLKMTYARGIFRIVEDDPDQNLVEVHGQPVMIRNICRNSNGQPDVRHRAEFPKWSMRITVKYDMKCITPSQLVNLFNQAGFSSGLGDWRPERGGSHGCFRVETTADLRS